MAMGLNEFAGYFAVAAAAWATGYIASTHGLRPESFYLGVGFVIAGLLLSMFAVRETHSHVHHEVAIEAPRRTANPTELEIFKLTSWKDRNLASATQAGLVNNLNDGLAWGLFPLIFAQAGMSLAQIGLLASIYPGVWGIAQLATGSISDRLGRKWLIASGMWVQAVGIAIAALSTTFQGFALGAVLLGLGTAMVYPTLLAAIGDVAHPSWRGSAVGVYRLWRDLGYAFGALIAGVVADMFGLSSAAILVAVLTFLSGSAVALRMSETLPARSVVRVSGSAAL